MVAKFGEVLLSKKIGTPDHRGPTRHATSAGAG